jgi:hypothetical protein
VKGRREREEKRCCGRRVIARVAVAAAEAAVSCARTWTSGEREERREERSAVVVLDEVNERKASIGTRPNRRVGMAFGIGAGCKNSNADTSCLVVMCKQETAQADGRYRNGENASTSESYRLSGTIIGCSLEETDDVDDTGMREQR